jgi:hypothetical protein
MVFSLTQLWAASESSRRRANDERGERLDHASVAHGVRNAAVWATHCIAILAPRGQAAQVGERTASSGWVGWSADAKATLVCLVHQLQLGLDPVGHKCVVVVLARAQIGVVVCCRRLSEEDWWMRCVRLWVIHVVLLGEVRWAALKNLFRQHKGDEKTES